MAKRPVLANPVEDLFAEEPAVLDAGSHPSPTPTTQDYINAIREQIIRDLQTLKSKEHRDELAPSREFYEQRVATFQSYLKELESRS